MKGGVKFKMTEWKCTRTNELQHHGIKGQKWGVRRFQNKDGSLTPAGKKRYDDGDGKRMESVTIDGQTFKVYGRNNKQYADKVAKKAKGMGAEVSRESKVKEKKTKTYKIPEKKSLHRLKLEEKYMKNGMTREEAEQAAAKRIRTEKFVAAAAVVTVASAVAYAKYKGYTTDKTIKANSDFQRIMRLSENAEIRKDHRQYLSFDKKDNIKYKGFLGEHFEQQIKQQHRLDSLVNKNAVADKIYDVTVKNNQEIKIASRKRAEDAFVNLFKNDSEFRKNLMDRAKEVNDEMGLQQATGERLFNGGKTNDRWIRTKAYDYFNSLLVDDDAKTASNANKFYEALRKQGMNAVADMNDKKYSGYNAKMPIITFDGDFDYSKRAMGSSEIAENLKKAKIMTWGPSIAKTGAFYVGCYSAAPVISKVQLDKKVLQYKQDHPNTNMTDKEIKAMIQEELQKGGGNSK